MLICRPSQNVMCVQYVCDAPICATVRPVENAGRAWHFFAVRIVAVLVVLDALVVFDVLDVLDVLVAFAALVVLVALVALVVLVALVALVAFGDVDWKRSWRWLHWLWWKNRKS